MLKEKIIESIGKRTNKEFSFWYKSKILELSGFLLKKAKEDVKIKSNNFSESRKLEVILK